MTRVAVVEDNPDNRLLVQAILDGHYDIVEYENGPDALAGFQELRPDLVLLDISLPGMDGTTVLQHIRSNPGMQSLKVIALTAHAMSGDRDRFLKLGFDAYMSKPITDDELLLITIKRLLTEDPTDEKSRSS